MLGDALWADIVAHTNACYEDAFSSAVPKPVLRCVGPPHGGACPHNFRVDLTSARAYATLGELHLDHEQDLVVTCDMWVQALAAPLPRAPRHIGTTASTACCCATYSSRCCKFRRTVAWKIYWGFSASFLVASGWAFLELRRSASCRVAEWFRSLISPSIRFYQVDEHSRSFSHRLSMRAGSSRHASCVVRPGAAEPEGEPAEGWSARGGTVKQLTD